MHLWRLVKTRHASSSFDGEGARLHGARWNSPGTRVAYAADSSALAVLEVLVQLKNQAILPSYSLVSARLPDILVENIDESTLPANWSSFPVPPTIQAIGDEWIRSGRSLALRVPSAIVQDGYNVLVNTEHSEFAEFKVEHIARFAFDFRLLDTPTGYRTLSRQLI